PIPPGTPLAVVARADAADPWQEALVSGLLARRPDAVLVDMGYRDIPVPAGTTVVKTYGAGLVNAVAAAELLAGRRSEGAPRTWW
ncbi:hypothetical protein EAO70_36030, partial [Streptomyces sp. adm13(2018)]